MTTQRQLLDDCFLHDKDRMKHAEVLETIDRNLALIVDDEELTINDAAGRVVAEDIIAPRNVPYTDNTAVDGYAFAHADYISCNGKLSLGALIAAGDAHEVTLKKGECARIFTGAIMPNNAETVAMQEDCDIGEDGKIHIPPGLKQGANCRKSGEDLKAGTPVVKQAELLTPAKIAALASIGIDKIKLRKKLRIAILSTGNEILESGQDFTAGKVYDANRPMLKALLDGNMVSITDLGILPDDESAITQAMQRASKTHDLILTSGGASRGDEDHMLNVLSNLGKRHLWQIAIKPGRPMMFGQIKNCVVVSLPGNPVASMVCANLYAYPVIAKLLGMKTKKPQGVNVEAAFEIKKKKTDRREFLRGWLEEDDAGNTIAVKFDRDGSGLITGLRKATGLIEIPENVNKINKGDRVRFVPFHTFKPE
ncbi:gephyrin-like molybdotransferase Glp [Ahrensia marina]|uniref:Molybdopterin molybdenumtransferase n=1 Tax=Ahrensia marina TaxID=1514904 RepID=A0A0N0E7A3_9HYPH|nr:gephyrin-like molybdotransferase Glp [Ahrensia marina]KPB00948.1 molybdopterin biosynthesis protein [Ahrensia marina]